MEEDKKPKKQDAMEGLRISRTTMPDQSFKKGSSANFNEDNFLKLLNLESREISMVISLDGQIKYVNHAIKKLLGFAPEHLLNASIQKIIPVEQWVAFRAALRASEAEAENPIVIDCRFFDYYEKKHEFSVSVKDLRHHPLVEGFVIHAHLIDRLKRQEEKLKLRNIAIELIQDAVVIVEPKMKKVVFANQAFYELSGFSKSDIMGGKLNLFEAPYSEMLFAEETGVKQIEKFRKAIQQNRKFDDRIYSKKKNGSVFYNRITVAPVFDEKEEVTHYIASMKETKSRKKK